MKRDNTASRTMALDQQPAGTPVQFPAVSPPICGHTYIGVRAETKTLKGVASGTYFGADCWWQPDEE
jgi:hypothetical protein